MSSAVSREWSDRVVKEFYAQGDLEKKQKLPVSPFMDRNKNSQSQMSMNFIDFIVGPIVGSVLQLAEIPDQMHWMVENMAQTREE